MLFRSFINFFARLFFRYFGHVCIGLAFLCARLVFRCIRVVRCVSLLFACNHSASPPGGNQVDGLPPALHCFFQAQTGHWPRDVNLWCCPVSPVATQHGGSLSTADGAI